MSWIELCIYIVNTISKRIDQENRKKKLKKKIKQIKIITWEHNWHVYRVDDDSNDSFEGILIDAD